MLRKLFLFCAACLAFAQAWADEPFRLHRYDSFQATPVTESSIVFVGNSITNMQPWAELFATPNVVNRGNSGGFSWEILSNVQSYITKRPKKLFVMIGTNDMNVAGYTPEAVVANVRQTVNHILKESPQTEVYVESVMASNNGSRTIPKGEELNRQLKAMALEMGVTFVDYFNETLNIANGGGMAYDNLHPHVLGTRAWTEVVANYVGGAAVLPESPIVYNGGQSNSYGARTSVLAQLPVTAEDVLFIGDEFVHSGEWQELLGNPNVKNRGTGWGKWGPDITYQTTCVPLFLDRLQGNVPPKQILLMVGTTNLTSSSSNKETFKTNYNALIEAIRSIAPSTKITLVSEIPYGPTATSLNIANLEPINQWLKEKAEANDNMDYCDLYSILTDDNSVAISKYLNSDQYVTGLGYQACARELAKYIDGCTVMSEEEAEAYYNLISARKRLSNIVDAIELGNINYDLTEHYALLANDAATISDFNNASSLLEAVVIEKSRPISGKWYTMTAKRNTTNFFKANGASLIYDSALNEYGESYWQFIERTDGTFDVKSGNGYYAVPTATHNVALTVSSTQPTTGWSLEESNVIGTFNIVAKVNNTAVNCCMNMTSNGSIYNWITNRKSDEGCQIIFAEVEFDPTSVIQPDTYTNAFKICTIENGEFIGEQWWYNVKIKNQYYLIDNGSLNYIPLNRTNVTTEAEEQWAFVGSDQKGYIVYNRKYGTSKVLAAPTTIANDNGSVYPVLVDANNVPVGYETRWQVEPSTQISGVDGFFMYSFEQPSHKLNNYGENGKLSFWLGGVGAGSTLSFEVAEAILLIEKDKGQFYRDGSGYVTSGWTSRWHSEITSPFQYTFGTGPNNMNAATMGIACGQTSGAWTFTTNDPQNYYIHSYSFEIKGANANQVITPNNGSAINLNTSSYVKVEWQNNNKGTVQASFTFTGANAEASIQNMVIVIRPVVVVPEPQYNVFEYGSPGNNVCYRIPAITTASNGNVIAVADYRYGGADIGFGRVSLRYRISKDNGQTWSDIKTLQESHGGNYGVDKANDLWAGFGDPAIVADRESGRVMALSCCGNVSYPAGTWEHHQGIAQFYSNDNGETWEIRGTAQYGIDCHWKDISPNIYQQFKDAGVNVAAMFVGSGRIFQSRTVKVNNYYRIYCVVLLRTPNTAGLNYVLFSDDFGETWDLLGGDNVQNAISSGDEPKCEELPDGSILVSSRAQGRLYNIFHFTDIVKGEGKWMSQAQSKNSNNGICEQGGNPTNGEIFMLPVVRNEDGAKMWMALQSVPFGNGRANVGIYYKALKNYSDYNNSANFAKDWDGRHQSSFMGSAYSTMTLQHNGTIGFLYEEETFGRAYTIVYKNYTIEQITDEQYSLDTESPINQFELTKNGIDVLKDGLVFSNYIGGLKPEAESIVDAAIETFKETPNQDNYINIFNNIASAPAHQLNVTKLYVIRNANRGGEGTYSMAVGDNNVLLSKAYNVDDESQQWAIVPTEAQNYYLLYNKSTKTYVMNLLATETAMSTTSDINQAGKYRLQQMNNDRFAIINMSPTNSTYNAIHAPGNYTVRMVCWTASGEASQWLFEITDIDSGIVDNIASVENQAEVKTAYDLQGRAVATPKRGLYIINRKKVVLK